MKLTDKQVEKIGGAIITSFVNLHFLEEVASIGIFRQRVKKNVKRTMDDLLDIENNYFNEVEETNGNNMADVLVANKLEFIKWILNEFDFNDFTKIQEVCIAFSKDKVKLCKTSDEILIKNGAKTIK